MVGAPVKRKRCQLSLDQRRALDRAWRDGLTSIKTDQQKVLVDKLANDLGISSYSVKVNIIYFYVIFESQVIGRLIIVIALDIE